MPPPQLGTRGALLSLESLRSFKRATYLMLRRDGVYTTSNVTPLVARPIHDLSVWAYLAIGVIVFASSMVVGYLIYSCYHLARSRGVGNSRESVVKSRLSRQVEGGEKFKGENTVRNVVELRALSVGRGSRHGRKYSESKRYITRPSVTTDSHTSFSNGSATEVSFDFDRETIASSPRLAHASERSAAYMEFYLPSPPSSPSPAHRKQYGDRVEMNSPVSPSPSFFPNTSPPPPITVKHERYGIQRIEKNGQLERPWSQSTTRAPRKTTKATPMVEFDSNNIRFLPPLNPFVPDSAVKQLYNEPKLSPIHGSIISPSTSPVKSTLTPPKRRAKGSTTPTFPPVPARPVSPARGRIIAGEQNTENASNLFFGGPRPSREENPPNPILRNGDGTGRRAPIVPVQPPPGYF